MIILVEKIDKNVTRFCFNSDINHRFLGDASLSLITHVKIVNHCVLNYGQILFKKKPLIFV